MKSKLASLRYVVVATATACMAIAFAFSALVPLPAQRSLRQTISFAYTQVFSRQAMAASGAAANYGTPLSNDDFPVPNPAPALPAGMDAFDPPSLGSQLGAVVAEHTRTGGPDDVVVLAGPAFSPGTTFRFYGQTFSGNAITVDRPASVADAVAASVIIPTQLPPWSMYLVWARNAESYGAPIAINRTEAWWIGPNTNTLTAGDTASIYGRNLAHGNGTTVSYVYIKPAGVAVGQWLVPTAVNPYRVNFTVPKLAAGSYEVWIHNGHGGRLGWSGPLAISILPQSTFAEQSSHVFDVRKYGAIGNGVADDSAAIQSALKAASAASPATVYFPAGTYMVGTALFFASNVSWAGASRETSIIKASAAFAANSHGPMIGTSQRTPVENVEFRDLTIDGNGNLGSYSIFRFEHNRNLKITNSRFDWKLLSHSNGPSVNGTDGIVITGTEFDGNGIFLGSAAQVVLDNNTFRLTDDASSAISSWGGVNLSITNNRAADYDVEGKTLPESGSGRFFVSQAHPDSNRNLYIADNTTRNFAPLTNLGDANEGEQILFEEGGFVFKGMPIKQSATTATFSSAPPAYGFEHLGQPVTSRDAMIIQGRGTGQTRHITNLSGNTITVSPSWSVTPDATSVIGIGAGQFRAVIYHNTFDGKKNYITYRTASAGLQMYGNVSDIVFANNALTNMCQGMVSETSIVPNSHELVPAALFFNLAASNSLVGSRWGLAQSTEFMSGENSGVIGHLGNSYRANTLANLEQIGIRLSPEHHSYAGGDFDQNVFEHNTMTNVPVAISTQFAPRFNQDTAVGTVFRNLVFYKNTFDRGGAALSGSSSVSLKGQTTSFWGSRNRFTGFEANGTGMPDVDAAAAIVAKPSASH